MAPTPRPDGWQGGSEDFGFLRTFDGHLASDRFSVGDEDTDANLTPGRNVRDGFAEADLSGTDYADRVERGA